MSVGQHIPRRPWNVCQLGSGLGLALRCDDLLSLKPALRDRLDLPRSALWDGFTPARHRLLGNAKRFGEPCFAPEVLDDLVVNAGPIHA